MKDNKKIIVIILAVALVLIIINVYSVTDNLFKQLTYINAQTGDIQNQINNMRSDLESFQGNIQEELKTQNSILSSYNISYSNGDAKALTGDITIELTPKEYSESTSASINLGDRLVPMSREGSNFAAVISVPIDIIYSQFIVSFKDGDAIRSEVVTTGDMGFVNELVNIANASFIGARTTYDVDNNYSYSGPVEIYASDPEKSFSGIKILAIKNDEVIWETDDFFHNKSEGKYTVDIDETFTLEKEDSLHLALEIKDSYGFIYKMPVYGTEIPESDGVTGASEDMASKIYDAEGKAIEFKYY